MDLIGDFSDVLYLVTLALTAVGVFAFIDAALRPAQAFVAAGKLTKPAWLVIVALSTFVLYLFGFISFFGIPALVAMIVYFVDVRPAVRNVTRGGSGSVGPYGPW